MDDFDKAEALLKQLDAQRQTFANTFQQLHEVLARGLATSGSRPAQDPGTPLTTALPALPRTPRSPRPSVVSRTTLEQELHGRKRSAALATLQTSFASRATGEDSDDDDENDGSRTICRAPYNPKAMIMRVSVNTCARTNGRLMPVGYYIASSAVQHAWISPPCFSRSLAQWTIVVI